jgi:hypothetical protein
MQYNNTWVIIHVIRLYNADGSNADLCRRKSIESGKQLVTPETDGAELMDELKPSPDIRLNSTQDEQLLGLFDT